MGVQYVAVLLAFDSRWECENVPPRCHMRRSLWLCLAAKSCGVEAYVVSEDFLTNGASLTNNGAEKRLRMKSDLLLNGSPGMFVKVTLRNRQSPTDFHPTLVLYLCVSKPHKVRIPSTECQFYFPRSDTTKDRKTKEEKWWCFHCTFWLLAQLVSCRVSGFVPFFSCSVQFHRGQTVNIPKQKLHVFFILDVGKLCH